MQGIFREGLVPSVHNFSCSCWAGPHLLSNPTALHAPTFSHSCSLHWGGDETVLKVASFTESKFYLFSLDIQFCILFSNHNYHNNK